MKRLLTGLMTVSLLLAGTSTLARGDYDKGRHHGPRPPAPGAPLPSIAR